jgi:hypothetical protein
MADGVSVTVAPLVCDEKRRLAAVTWRQKMRRTERTVSRETSSGGEHLEIWNLLEGCHRLHRHLTYASQCNDAEKRKYESDGYACRR